MLCMHTGRSSSVLHILCELAWCWDGINSCLASRALTLVVQDGKYDKLLRLLYDDIQKYETEVTGLLFSCAAQEQLCLSQIHANHHKNLDYTFRGIPNTRQLLSYHHEHLSQSFVFASYSVQNANVVAFSLPAPSDSVAVVQMLDADDAILEQAMQTGAALKRARDLQKAARKPKVITHVLTLSLCASMSHRVAAIVQLGAGCRAAGSDSAEHSGAALPPPMKLFI